MQEFVFVATVDCGKENNQNTMKLIISTKCNKNIEKVRMMHDQLEQKIINVIMILWRFYGCVVERMKKVRSFNSTFWITCLCIYQSICLSTCLMDASQYFLNASNNFYKTCHVVHTSTPHKLLFYRQILSKIGEQKDKMLGEYNLKFTKICLWYKIRENFIYTQNIVSIKF